MDMALGLQVGGVCGGICFKNVTTFWTSSKGRWEEYEWDLLKNITNVLSFFLGSFRKDADTALGFL